MKREKRDPNYELKVLAIDYDEKYHIMDVLSSLDKINYQIDNGILSHEVLTKGYGRFLLGEIDKLNEFNPYLLDECIRIRNADKQRKRRLRSRIQSYFDEAETVVFVSLEFNDFLERSSSDYRRKVVRDFLASFAESYCANIDFGKRNGREHYHALVTCRVPKERLFFWRENYGSINCKLVHKDIEDKARLASYIAKLTNHAMKNTTNRVHLIYSRKKKS